MNTPNIEKLLVRYYNDELPFDQTARVAAWIAASEENRKIAEQIYYIWFPRRNAGGRKPPSTPPAHCGRSKAASGPKNGAGHSGRSSARPPSCCCPWSACRPIC